MLNKNNRIQCTVKSDSWNNGYVDGIMGYGQDDDYVKEMEYKQDIVEYLDGVLIGLDAYDIMNNS